MEHLKDWIIRGMLCLPRYANSTAPRFPAQATIQSGGPGGLGPGTFYYKVVGLDNSGDPISWISNEVSITVGSSSSVAVSWEAIPGATGYYVYRGTSTDGENQYVFVAGAGPLSDTGFLSWTGGAPDGSWYTQKVLNNINLGGATFVGLTGTGGTTFDITGFAGGTNGRVLILYVENVGYATIAHESVWSDPANRIFTLKRQGWIAYDWFATKDVRQDTDGNDLDARWIGLFIYHPDIVSGVGRWLYIMSNGDNLSG